MYIEHIEHMVLNKIDEHIYILIDFHRIVAYLFY